MLAIDYPEFCIMLADIYIDLSETKNIQTANLTRYKDFISSNEEYKDNLNYGAGYLVFIVEKYFISIKNDMIPSTLSIAYEAVLNNINSYVAPIDVATYKRCFDFIITDDKNKDFSVRIVDIENLVETGTIDNIFLEFEYYLVLIKLYILDPKNYVNKMVAASTRVKELTALRNEKLKVMPSYQNVKYLI
jgi:hypothetical protein